MTIEKTNDMDIDRDLYVNIYFTALYYRLEATLNITDKRNMINMLTEIGRRCNCSSNNKQSNFKKGVSLISNEAKVSKRAVKFWCKIIKKFVRNRNGMYENNNVKELREFCYIHPKSERIFSAIFNYITNEDNVQSPIYKQLSPIMAESIRVFSERCDYVRRGELEVLKNKLAEI